MARQRKIIEELFGKVEDPMQTMLTGTNRLSLIGRRNQFYNTLLTKDKELALVVGVDTQVFHGIVNCGATGVITGIGNVIPEAVIKLFDLCIEASNGVVNSRRLAIELNDALKVLSTFDEGPDLVLYYKFLLYLKGEKEYAHNFNVFDRLNESQSEFATKQLNLFNEWWKNWDQ